MKYKQLFVLSLFALHLVVGTIFNSNVVSAIAVDEGGVKTRRIICLDGANSPQPLDVPQTTTDYTKACKDAGYKSYQGMANMSGTTNGVDCPDEGDCAEKTAFSFNCGGSTPQNTNVGLSCLFLTVLNFMSAAVGILVVGGITAGGIMYAASGGNASRKAQGTKIISNAVIGLIIYLLLWAIVNFLIPGGVFTS